MSDDQTTSGRLPLNVAVFDSKTTRAANTALIVLSADASAIRHGSVTFRVNHDGPSAPVNVRSGTAGICDGGANVILLQQAAGSKRAYVLSIPDGHGTIRVSSPDFYDEYIEFDVRSGDVVDLGNLILKHFASADLELQTSRSRFIVDKQASTTSPLVVLRAKYSENCFIGF